jgi:hypothetical protein
MKSNKIIAIVVDDELGLLIEKVKKDYCINVSGLARMLLIKELRDSGKYKLGGNK